MLIRLTSSDEPELTEQLIDAARERALITPPPSLLPAKPSLPPSATVVPALALMRLSESIQLTDLQLKENKHSKKGELNH